MISDTIEMLDDRLRGQEIDAKKGREYLKILREVKDKDAIRYIKEEDPILTILSDIDFLFGQIGLLLGEENNISLSHGINALEFRISYPAKINELKKGKYVFQPIPTPYINNKPREKGILFLRSGSILAAGEQKVDEELRKYFNLSFNEYKEQIVDGIKEIQEMACIPSKKEIKRIFPNYPFDYYK
jgi:hypothetical protein